MHRGRTKLWLGYSKLRWYLGLSHDPGAGSRSARILCPGNLRVAGCCLIGCSTVVVPVVVVSAVPRVVVVVVIIVVPSVSAIVVVALVIVLLVVAILLIRVP